jgi:hypothetical protein
LRQNGDDGAGAGRHRALDRLHRKGEAHRLDVGEHCGGAGHANGIGSRNEGQVRDDHLVARTDALRHQRERYGRGAAGDRDRVPGTGELRDALLELSGQRAVVDEIAIDRSGEARELAAGHLRFEPCEPFGHATSAGHFSRPSSSE